LKEDGMGAIPLKKQKICGLRTRRKSRHARGIVELFYHIGGDNQ